MVHDSEEYKLLQHYTTKPLSYSTVLRWMHHLGYHRGRHQKSYFVDGHEHKEQKAHRKKHTTQYLTVEEPRSHRWVQITVEEHQKLKDEAPEKNPLPETGFKYVDSNTGATMVELHVDDHVSIQKIANEKYGEFGGTTSVRKPDGAKPVIMFGQDEAAYSQNSFNSEQWVSPTGERALLPKTSGHVIMVSAMESRETGWGIAITEDIMRKVNDMRKNEKYLDEVAAQAVHGTSDKKDLTDDPFVRLFEFGGANGYWTGNHVLVQIEDCVDLLRVKYGDAYDYRFILDSSSGHVKKRTGGLDATKMTKLWGGFKPRNTLIEDSSYLGRFHNPDNPRMVKVGKEQTLVYTSKDNLQNGPFNLSTEQLEDRRHDVDVPLPEKEHKMVNKEKKELVDDLMKTDLGKMDGKNVLQNKLVRELRKSAEKLDINTKE